MRFSDNGTTFLTKRFDRIGVKRIHYASAMTMAGKTDMEPAGYLDIVSAIENICQKPQRDLRELWNRMIFDSCVSNTDNHLRNHGFLLSNKGWMLSPCFDVNPNPENVMMALSVGDTGEKSIKNAYDIADFFRLSGDDAKESIRWIQSIVRENWEAEADKLKISRAGKERMKPAFEVAYSM